MLSLKRLLRRPRLRKRRIVIIFMIGAMVYFTYQFGFISELSESKKEIKYRSVKVEKFADVFSVNNELNVNKMANEEPESKTSGSVFRCQQSQRLIASDKVNDDYCDCPEDGSDEFLTDACDKAVFICKSTKRGFPSKIVSAWVNDGVCDCCDGSDEWQEKNLILSLSHDFQKKIHRWVSPCEVLC